MSDSRAAGHLRLPIPCLPGTIAHNTTPRFDKFNTTRHAFVFFPLIFFCFSSCRDQIFSRPLTRKLRLSSHKSPWWVPLHDVFSSITINSSIEIRYRCAAKCLQLRSAVVTASRLRTVLVTETEFNCGPVRLRSPHAEEYRSAPSPMAVPHFPFFFPLVTF